MKNPSFFVIFYYSNKALSQTLLLLERKKVNCYCFHVEIAFYFEKRAKNFIQMYKITFTTLKSAFRF
jgi:hypothetical protein